MLFQRKEKKAATELTAFVVIDGLDLIKADEGKAERLLKEFREKLDTDSKAAGKAEKHVYEVTVIEPDGDTRKESSLIAYEVGKALPKGDVSPCNDNIHKALAAKFKGAGFQSAKVVHAKSFSDLTIEGVFSKSERS